MKYDDVIGKFQAIQDFIDHHETLNHYLWDTLKIPNPEMEAHAALMDDIIAASNHDAILLYTGLSHDIVKGRHNIKSFMVLTSNMELAKDTALPHDGVCSLLQIQVSKNTAKEMTDLAGHVVYALPRNITIDVSKPVIEYGDNGQVYHIQNARIV